MARKKAAPKAQTPPKDMPSKEEVEEAKAARAVPSPEIEAALDYAQPGVADQFMGVDPVGAKDEATAKVREEMRTEAEGKPNTAIECLRFLSKFGTGRSKLDLIKTAAMRCNGEKSLMSDVLNQLSMDVASGLCKPLPSGTLAKIKEFMAR